MKKKLGETHRASKADEREKEKRKGITSEL